MTAETHTGNDPATEPTLFSAVITPHRSLSGTGFLLVMTLVGTLSFIGGMFFFLLGAWPVVGFLGLDVLLVYWAFRASYRTAAAFEEVTVTVSELRVRRVSHRGQVSEWTFNPLWVRLDQEVDEEYGIEHLYLISRSRRLRIAGFLGPEEKASFHKALVGALNAARRGPTYNPVT
jgi:uncharacterized membrane protein